MQNFIKIKRKNTNTSKGENTFTKYESDSKRYKIKQARKNKRLTRSINTGA